MSPRITPVLFGLGLVLAPVSGAAQDADPVGQLVEGYVACLLGEGDPDIVDALFADSGWTSGPGEDGLISFAPGSGEASFAYMADDGSFCHVESMVVDSATASEVLATTLQSAGQTGIEYEKDDMGCTLLRLADGRGITITSGGNDPNCGSDTDSGVRFATE